MFLSINVFMTACCVPGCCYFSKLVFVFTEKKNRIWLQKFNEAKFFKRKKNKNFLSTPAAWCKYENHYHMLTTLTMQMTMADKEIKKFMNLQHTRKSLFSFCFLIVKKKFSISKNWGWWKSQKNKDLKRLRP